MSFLATHMWSKTHHHCFGNNESSSGVKIVEHLFLIDDEARESKVGLVEGPHRNNEAFWHSNPLQMPWPRGALKVGDHAIQHEPRIRAEDFGSGKDDFA